MVFPKPSRHVITDHRSTETDSSLPEVYNVAQFRRYSLNLQYVKSNSIATLKRTKTDSARFWFFSTSIKQPTYVQKKKTKQIQFHVALQLNALSYMRTAVITDKCVESQFVLTKRSAQRSFSSSPQFIGLPQLAHTTSHSALLSQKRNRRYAWQNEIQVIFIKTGLSQSEKT